MAVLTKVVPEKKWFEVGIWRIMRMKSTGIGRGWPGTRLVYGTILFKYCISESLGPFFRVFKRSKIALVRDTISQVNKAFNINSTHVRSVRSGSRPCRLIILDMFMIE